MELILLKDVDQMGRRGDVIRVRDGYARNFLIPRKLAFAATRENQEMVAQQRVRAEKRQAKERTEAQNQARQLEQLKWTIQAEAGEQDKLYGAITSEDIRQLLAEKNFNIDKRKILLKEPIRSVGKHTVAVELYSQVRAQLSVEVVRKS